MQYRSREITCALYDERAARITQHIGAHVIGEFAVESFASAARSRPRRKIGRKNIVAPAQLHRQIIVGNVSNC